MAWRVPVEQGLSLVPSFFLLHCLPAACLHMQKPLVPFEEKLHAIAYVNSNCGAQSGRSEIMRKLIAMGDKAKVCACVCGVCVGCALSVSQPAGGSSSSWKRCCSATQRRPCLHTTHN